MDATATDEETATGIASLESDTAAAGEAEADGEEDEEEEEEEEEEDGTMPAFKYNHVCFVVLFLSVTKHQQQIQAMSRNQQQT